MNGNAHSLIIGYGNELRCDDGAGRVIAQRMDALRPPRVDIHDTRQLTPELAASIAAYDRVLFIDAYPATAHDAALVIQGFDSTPQEQDNASTHSVTPHYLLHLARILYAAQSQGFILGIPGYHFGPGEALSPGTRQAVERAMHAITHWLLTVEQGSLPCQPMP